MMVTPGASATCLVRRHLVLLQALLVLLLWLASLCCGSGSGDGPRPLRPQSKSDCGDLDLMRGMSFANESNRDDKEGETRCLADTTSSNVTFMRFKICFS